MTRSLLKSKGRGLLTGEVLGFTDSSLVRRQSLRGRPERVWGPSRGLGLLFGPIGARGRKRMNVCGELPGSDADSACSHLEVSIFSSSGTFSSSFTSADIEKLVSPVWLRRVLRDDDNEAENQLPFVSSSPFFSFSSPSLSPSVLTLLAFLKLAEFLRPPSPSSSESENSSSHAILLS